MRIPIVDINLKSKLQVAGMAILIITAAAAGPLCAYSTGQMAFQKRDMGIEARQAGNYQEALKHLQRSVDIVGNRLPEYRVDLAQTHHEMGNHQKAITEYSELLEEKPGYTPALLGRADSYQAIGAEKLALQDRRNAAGNGPE